MMSQTVFLILAAVSAVAAVGAVTVRSTLYAVLCQMQAMTMLTGILILSGLKYAGLVLFSLNVASFILFLLFDLMTGDKKADEQPLPRTARGVISVFLCVAPAEIMWFFYASFGAVNAAATFQPLPATARLMGARLFVDRPFPVCLFGALLTVYVVGVTVLLSKKDAASLKTLKNKGEK